MSQVIQDFITGQPFGSGSDGAYNSVGSATDSPINTTCSGASGQKNLTIGAASTFANGNLVLIHQTQGTGVGQWEVNKIASGGGTITLVMQSNLAYTYASGAQVLVIKQYSSFTQGSGYTLTAKAWDGSTGGILTFSCSGDATITGNISTVGKGYRGGSVIVTSSYVYQGEGTSGTGNTSNAANSNGGGGGLHNGNISSGGGGGNGGSGANGAVWSGGGDTFGIGGGTCGNTTLTNMNPGGAGGGGAPGGHSGDRGGTGTGGTGGAIGLIFAKKITVTGSINSTGGAGSAGNFIDMYPSAGGGGGSGGSILIKAEDAILGETKVTAIGGAGGAGSSGGGYTTYAGGNGGVGYIHLDYGNSYSGTTNPTFTLTKDTSLVSGGFLSVLLETN